MLQYTLKRLLIAIPTLLGITIITFSLITLAPGNPAEMVASQEMDPERAAAMYEQLAKHFELDRPVPERYVRWLGRTLTGDFGNSFHDGQPVINKIKERFWPTASLALISMFLGLVFSIPIGLLQAYRQEGLFDKGSGIFFYALYAIPSYVMAILLIYYVGVKWEWLPFRGMESDNHDQLTFMGQMMDYGKHYVLITFCYTFQSIAFSTRFTRGNLLEVLRQDYVRTARAKGVKESVVIFRHAFRNTLIPLITRLGGMLPLIISGSVILEVIFNWPGLGRLFFEAILTRDYPVVMANTVISATLVLLGVLIADLSYALVDPRISHE
ncbi:MAG: ABC transporter permease [Planctomycetota bacterium]|jgi:peptide/nickel transport system permease protein